MPKQTLTHFFSWLSILLLLYVAYFFSLSGDFSSQQKVIEVLFILGFRIVIQLNHLGEGAEKKTDLDL